MDGAVGMAGAGVAAVKSLIISIILSNLICCSAAAAAWSAYQTAEELLPFLLRKNKTNDNAHIPFIYLRIM